MTLGCVYQIRHCQLMERMQNLPLDILKSADIGIVRIELLLDGLILFYRTLGRTQKLYGMIQMDLFVFMGQEICL